MFGRNEKLLQILPQSVASSSSSVLLQNLQTTSREQLLVPLLCHQQPVGSLIEKPYQIQDPASLMLVLGLVRMQLLLLLRKLQAPSLPFGAFAYSNKLHSRTCIQRPEETEDVLEEQHEQ